MRFIIFDLEATCWEGNQVGRNQEVIEFGAVSANQLGDSMSTFKRLVRPEQNPRLSYYCTHLTGITQGDVDTAKPFNSVVIDFMEWIDIEDEEYLLCSWGDKDIEFLQSDCRYNGIETEWLHRYIDLKAQYHSIRGLQKKRGLKRVLTFEQIEFEGSHHRAFDDAANLFSLFTKYRDMWMY
ncbi:MAG: 3'-5' exonuclease [Bacteroidetes bacterium]|nr:MAG: 3'-5' exonuclease [Bacteroidota bacterium]